MSTRPALCGLILAGGRSRRMGTDKAALIHPDGRSLVRRCYDLLDEAGCKRILISLRHDQPLPDGLSDLAALEIVRDPAEGSVGPMVGIASGMRLQPAANWLVLACDLPRLDTETLRHLIDSLELGEKFLAYRSESDGLPEPLCTLYGSAALPLLEEAIATDMRCPRKILIRENCRLLEAVTPRALANANTPEDWLLETR